MQILDFNDLPTIGGKNVDISFEYSSELIFVHLVEVRGLTRETLKELIFLRDEWTKFLRTVGYPSVFGIVPENNTIALKLADRFGFVEHSLKDGHVIVRLDLGEV